VTDERRTAWEARTEWPLTVLAVIFLIAYALPIPGPDVHPAVRTTCARVGWAVWVGFAVDHVVRWRLSESRWRFVRGHAVDLAVLVLPLLRPLRLLRLLTLLDVLNRRAANSLRGRVAIYVTGASGLIIFC